MRKLIVNADDFGLTRGINKGIARGFRLGIVTSASAMVNMPCWDHAAELAKRLPGLSVGLHFNLTLGCPVTPPRSVPTLVDAQGRFHGDLKQLAAADPLDITRELYNQYNRLCRSGIAPSHVDGHQGIHALDNILAVLLDFAARLGLPLRLAPHARERYKAAGAVTTGALIDQFQGRGATRPNFERLLRECRAETAEFRCRPGMVDADLENLSAYTWQRERELAVVCAYARETFPQECGYQLISFAQLPAGG